MRWLKDFKGYKESIVIKIGVAEVGDLLESLSLWHEELLNSIGAIEEDLFKLLELDKSEYDDDKLDLDKLSGNGKFIDALSKKWKKSEVQNSNDSETFLNKPCKFMFIYPKDAESELLPPAYLMFQTSNDDGKTWEPAKLYKVTGDANKFYEILSTATLKIVDGDKAFIYATSNGNNWKLKNQDNEDESKGWLKELRMDELQANINLRKDEIDLDQSDLGNWVNID